MLKAHKVGLALGGFLGLMHLVWALMVMLGVAQACIDFIYRIHMLQIPILVLPFDLGLSAALIVVTAIMGYVFGWVFAKVYNWAHK